MTKGPKIKDKHLMSNDCLVSTVEMKILSLIGLPYIPLAQTQKFVMTIRHLCLEQLFFLICTFITWRTCILCACINNKLKLPK